MEPCGPVQACNGIVLPLPLPLGVQTDSAEKINGILKIIFCRALKCVSVKILLQEEDSLDYGLKHNDCYVLQRDDVSLLEVCPLLRICMASQTTREHYLQSRP
jgi:hypothetical protein